MAANDPQSTLDVAGTPPPPPEAEESSAPDPADAQGEGPTPNPRKVVPLELTRMTFGADGPKEVTETRHVYFNMAAYDALLDAWGINANEAARMQQEADDPDELEEMRGNFLEQTETGLSFIENISLMLWAGLQAEAKSRGEDLTKEQVEQWVDMDNQEKVAAAVGEAFNYFLQGTEAEEVGILDDEDEQEEDEKKGPPQTKAPR